MGGCAAGEAKITKGYNLPAKFVIHTVGPVWAGGKAKEEELLAACYRNSLDLAQKHSIKSIVFPSISTGAYRFPIQLACLIALKTVQARLKNNPGIFQQIIFVLFSDNDLNIYRRAYLDIFGPS